MDLRCVTRNLGRWASGQTWLDDLAAEGQTDLIFLQEVPWSSGLLVPGGFHGFPGDLEPLRDRGHCRSLTLVAEHLVASVCEAAFVVPDLLGEYVTEMILNVSGCTALRLVNVHASPKPVTFGETPVGDWRRAAEARVYYSDVISRELALRAEAGRLVAVGDFNEALLWDERHDTTTSAEFFQRLATHGLTDVTSTAWLVEVTTQTKHPYQVDRIVATSDVSVRVLNAAQAVGPDDGLSDHLPLAFTIVL